MPNACAVPNCNSGYRSCKKKISVFSFPKDNGMRKKWIKAIQRKDKFNTKYVGVCELHFEPHLIEKCYTHIINGEKVEIARGKPVLSRTAIPTIYPNLPSYLRKPVSAQWKLSKEASSSETSQDSFDTTDEQKDRDTPQSQYTEEMFSTQEFNITPAWKSSKRCFIPGCYSNKQKRSLFSAPKNAIMFEKWKKALPRTNKAFTAKHSLCELHFEPHLIERFYKHVIQNELILLERFRPRLDPNAVPTIFPSSPSYYTKQTPKKRNTRNSTKNSLVAAPSMPIRHINPTMNKVFNKEMPKTDEENACSESQPAETSSSIQIASVYTVLKTKFDLEEESQSLTIHIIQDFLLPSKYWSRHLFSDYENKVVFSYCSLETLGKSALMSCDKLVIVNTEDTKFMCSAYVQGVEVITPRVVKTKKELDDILKTVDGKHCCRGLGSFSQFPEMHELFSKLKCYNNTLFHKACKGETDGKNGRCVGCGFLKRCLDFYHSKTCKKQKTKSNPSLTE